MVYTFQCRKCDARFQVTESLAEHERHREKCPKCKSKDVEQRMEPVYVATSRKS